MTTKLLSNGMYHVKIKKGTETYITECSKDKIDNFLRWVFR